MRVIYADNNATIFHTDATQSVGKVPLHLEKEYRHVDLLSFSGHKLHAPKGVGVLYMKRGTPCRPLLIGGHQEEGRRAGTENTPYIVGLAKALELAAGRFEEEETRIRSLRDQLETALEKQISQIQVNGRDALRLPNTLNVACHYVEGEAMLYQLSDCGICASSGSACTSGSLEPSHVLRAMHVPFTAVHGSVRFSFSRYNTQADVEQIIQVFPQIVANLRKLSPYWDQEHNRPRGDAPESTWFPPYETRQMATDVDDANRSKTGAATKLQLDSKHPAAAISRGATGNPTHSEEWRLEDA